MERERAPEHQSSQTLGISSFLAHIELLEIFLPVKIKRGDSIVNRLSFYKI